jgi:hypothetical protein
MVGLTSYTMCLLEMEAVYRKEMKHMIAVKLSSSSRHMKAL